MTNTCVCGCGRTLIDGYAHHHCTERARQQLLGDDRDPDRPGIVELVEPARAIAYRQTAGESTASSAPGPRDLIDYGAGQRLMTVQIALTGWGRMIAEERGVGVNAHGEDMIVAAARYIADHLEWSRHKPWVDELLRELGDCAATMRGIVATPAGRVYLGVCGAERWVPDPGDAEFGADVECDGDVFGKPGRTAAYCNTCGAAYDQAERRTQVAKLVQGVPMRASVIAHAHGISVDTIRGWAWVRRDKDGNPLNEPKLKAAGRDDRGRPLYLVADVLALQRQAEQRRQQRAAQAAGMGA